MRNLSVNRRLTTLQFLDVCHSPVAEIFRYWDSRRAGRPLPERSDINPADIVRHLPGLVLVDVRRDPLDFIYRLIGTREVTARGCDPTGKRVADYGFGSTTEDVVANYERVVATRSFLYHDDEFVRPGGRFVHDESLFLPLATGGEEVGQIMVYSYYSDLWAQSLREAARTRGAVSL
jgi:hypothetical protein